MREYNNLPAQFNERIHAFAVDMIPVFLAVIIVIFMGIPFALKIGIILFIILLFNFMPSLLKSGSSIGKHSSKIIVVNEDHSEVSLVRMFSRELFVFSIIFLSSGLYCFVAFYVLNKRIDKRSIHDLIFKTRVVNIESYIHNR